MKKYTRQCWVGCMAQENSLLLNDIVKMPCTAHLHSLCSKLYKRVMNHGDCLSLFREKVAAHFDEKAKVPPHFVRSHLAIAGSTSTATGKRGKLQVHRALQARRHAHDVRV